MSHEACPMAALVEARQSGRLGETEAHTLDRHLAACTECAALARDLARLAELARRPVPALGDLDRRRARLRLLRDAANAGVRARSTTRSIAAAAVIAAAVAGLWLRPSTPPREVAAVGTAAETAATAIAPAPSAAHAAAEVRGEEGARFVRSRTPGLDRVVLETGAVVLSVRPLAPGDRFVVATSDAEVEVRGTVFRVAAEAGRLRDVSVAEGKVEVRRGGESVLVTPGHAWHADVAAAPAAASAARPGASARRGAPKAPERAAARAASSAPPDDGAAAFAAGVESLGRGDYDTAAKQLAAFRDRSPADPRAEDAAFLVVIAHDRAGDAAAAKAAAERYLAGWPDGRRVAEARAIAAGAPR